MKNKLFISNFESCTENGFWSKGMADAMVKREDSIIRNSPDFLSLNEYDTYLSSVSTEQSENIDTIIQYLAIDDMEYVGGYKNIFVANIPHFPKRNLSAIDKLSIADEIWVFDDQYKDFLGSNLANKTVVVGYPYSKNRVAKLFENKQASKNNRFIFYSITDISHIDNMMVLIFNFLLVFHSFDTNLTIYLKHTDDINLDEVVKSLLEKIKEQFKIIDPSIINNLITIISGNPYVDTENHINTHIKGDCYINIDHIVSSDVITASFLGKYILSIMNIADTIKYVESSLIETTPTNYKTFFGPKEYFNEFNSFPRINDLSMQNKLIGMYDMLKNKINPAKCYELVNEDKFYK